MEKDQFSTLLKRYNQTSEQEATEILLLKDKYPYSQLLQALAARISKDHALENQQALLQSAAVHSTDRAILKEVMTAVLPQMNSVFSDNPAPADTLADQNEVIHQAIDSVDIAAEVIADLKQLSKLKHDFEDLIAHLPTPGTVETEDKPKAKRKAGRPRKKKPDAESSDPIIEEIKTTKKKIQPGTEKAKEQIEIIDQFIKAQPKISPRAADSKAISDTNDLSTGNSEFGGNVVSETLVDILLKQGKKEKAVEVLRKLIWKFPQKKTYFAAKIQELTK